MKNGLDKKKYTLTHVSHDGTKISMEFYHEYLGDIMEEIALFLKACGFSPVSIDKYIDLE